MLPELESINKRLFSIFEIELTTIEPEPESQEYSALTFYFGNKKVKFRVAKTTPKKVGQFVSIWKRSENGTTEPHDVNDAFEFYVIATKLKSRLGVFLFNKMILDEKKILTNKESVGKRGFRVYPNWDVTTNRHAQETQRWQRDYFIEISEDREVEIGKAKKLLNLE